jgi:hypothetical protein
MFKCLTVKKLPNFNILLNSAKKARLAYLKPNEMNHLWEDKDIIFKDAISYPKYISKNNADAYFWTEKDTCQLIIRGTDNFYDVLADIDLKLICIKDKIKVHRGFYEQFAAIEPDISLLLEKETCNKLHISAHSLGAGVGQIAAAYYGERNKEVTIHTIGCPRTGNAEFVKWFTANVKENIRIVNQHDPVCTIPISPKWIHTYNNSIVLKDKMDYSIYNNNIDIFYKWFRPFAILTYNIDFDAPIKEHICDFYVENLEKYCKLYNK